MFRVYWNIFRYGEESVCFKNFNNPKKAREYALRVRGWVEVIQPLKTA